MTTTQMAKKMGVTQPRIIELENAEIDGAVSLKNLERAAAVLGCRVVYALIPNKPLAETLRQRALAAAERQLSAVEQTMSLEDQAVSDKNAREKARRQLADDLLKKPTRLWDDE